MELLNIELIQNYSPWHEKIHFFESIDSTNTHALQLGETGAPEGTAVIAEEQLRGRGQFERPWFSPARTGLWMSLLLRPTIKPETIPALSHFAVVALYDAILKMKIPINDLERFKKSYGRCSARNEELSPAVYADTRGHEHWSDAAMRNHHSFENALKIKEPNDLLIGKKKVAGVLVETRIGKSSFAVVGIGLNVLQQETDFPPELREKVTSLSLASGIKNINRQELVGALLQALHERYQQVLHAPDLLEAAWREKL